MTSGRPPGSGAFWQYSLEADCGGGGGVCGDGVCNGSDTTANCPGDCGSFCGNGYCEKGEGKANCPQDCGYPVVCGNGICEKGENPKSCGIVIHARLRASSTPPPR